MFMTITKKMERRIAARDTLMDTIKELRKLPEGDQDEIINPLEAAVYALAELIY